MEEKKQHRKLPPHMEPTSGGKGSGSKARSVADGCVGGWTGCGSPFLGVGSLGMQHRLCRLSDVSLVKLLIFTLLVLGLQEHGS